MAARWVGTYTDVDRGVYGVRDEVDDSESVGDGARIDRSLCTGEGGIRAALRKGVIELSPIEDVLVVRCLEAKVGARTLGLLEAMGPETERVEEVLGVRRANFSGRVGRCFGGGVELGGIACEDGRRCAPSAPRGFFDGGCVIVFERAPEDSLVLATDALLPLPDGSLGSESVTGRDFLSAKRSAVISWSSCQVWPSRSRSERRRGSPCVELMRVPNESSNP